ncbi:MAG: acyl-CoA dehydrogenase, partial [Janthinobacterium lividum]
DPHTLAHLAAMHANVWAMRSLLQTAGEEIDAQPDDVLAAQRRALTVRHLIEQLATDLLRRFARAYGPVPLAMHEQTARRYQEVDLFLRQAHGERDLESLARLIQTKGSAG